MPECYIHKDVIIRSSKHVSPSQKVFTTRSTEFGTAKEKSKLHAVYQIKGGKHFGYSYKAPSKLSLRDNNLREWGFNSKSISAYYSRLFSHFAALWKMQTGGHSNIRKIIKNENYKKIIEIGTPMLPYIFKDLNETRAYWFVALEEITKATPVPDEDFGDVEKMTTHWINWSKQANKN